MKKFCVTSAVASILVLAGSSAFGSPAKSVAKAPAVSQNFANPATSKVEVKNNVKDQNFSFGSKVAAFAKYLKTDSAKAQKLAAKVTRFQADFNGKEFVADKETKFEGDFDEKEFATKTEAFDLKSAQFRFGSTKFASLKIDKQFDFNAKVVKDAAKKYNKSFNKLATS